MLHELLDVDGRLWLTLKTLLFKPGLLTLEYNQGKRVKYSPPLRMYLAISILFFILFSNISFNIPAEHQSFASFDEHHPKIMFMLLPVFALIFQVFYRKTYYVANLIFAIHIHCMTYIVLAIIAPLEPLADREIFFAVIQGLFFSYLVLYILFAIKRNYNESWFSTIWKYISISLIYLSIMGFVFDFVLHYLQGKIN